MNVLEMLQQYLAQATRPPPDEDALPGDDMIQRMRQAALPPDLPPAVVRSILAGQSYGEGEMPTPVRRIGHHHLQISRSTPRL